MITIKRSHKIVLLAAFFIAAGSTFFMLSRQKEEVPKNRVSYRSFKTEQGWGYDILVGQRIFIHQPFIPGAAGNAGFHTQQQADSAAQSVIEKIKSGRLPIISHQ